MSATGSVFQAHAFNPDLGSEVIEGEIRIDHGLMKFRSELLSLDLPLVRLQVNLGEGEDSRVFFSDPDHSPWQIFTADAAVLDHRDLANDEHIRGQLIQTVTRRELSSRLRVTLWVLGVCAAIAAVGWLGTVIMVEALVARIPPKWEQQYGDSVMVTLQSMWDFVDDTNRVAGVATLAAPLAKALPPGTPPLKFHIVDDEEPNAMALPGGHVIIHTGLLELMDRPEELLGVIAHEMAHVTERHGFREAISQAGPFIIFTVFLGGGRGVMGVITDGSALMVEQSFSQSYETEADDVGWKFLVAAKIDPRGMPDALRKLKAWEATQIHDGPELPQAFSSHPALEKRITRLESKWKKLPQKDGFLSLKAESVKKPK